MVAINYNRDIPDAPNNPSQDQPLMKANTNGVYDILDVDHITFETEGGGTHKQTTFINKFPAAAQTDPSSVLYTGDGDASAVADLFYRNQNGIFRPNIIKAAGVFTTNFLGPPANPFPILVTKDNGFNIVSINKTSSTKYEITFTANAIVGTNVIVLLNIDNDVSITYTYVANLLTLTLPSTAGNRKVSFAMLQV